jgi:manganese efflux pump family protein
MNTLNLIGIAIGLAMDAFAVSIAVGIILPRVTLQNSCRLAFHFGFFQAIMPIIGWLAGSNISDTLAAWDHWIAFGLLSTIGGKMVYDGIKGEAAKLPSDPTHGLLLITLSIATSIDALAVGLSMGLLGVSVWIPAIVIGLVAAAMSVIGISLGKRLGTKVDRWAYLIGGGVLIFIGLRILLTDLKKF